MCGISVVVRLKRRSAPAAVEASQGVEGSHDCSLSAHSHTAASFACCTFQPTSIDIDVMQHYNACRGPDVTSSVSMDLEGCEVSVVATGSILHLRGSGAPSLSPQPMVNQRSALGLSPQTSAEQTTTDCAAATVSRGESSWLLWNGEVFGGATVVVPAESCDTEFVMRTLVERERLASSVESMENAAREVLEGIQGPFAVMFYSARFRILVFGRDPIGRRSLLVHKSRETPDGVEVEKPLPDAAVVPEVQDEVWIVSSVAAPHRGDASLHEALRESKPVVCKKHSSCRAGIGASADVDDDEDGDGNEEDASAVEGGCWSEVPTGGVFVLSLSVSSYQTDSNPCAVMRHTFSCCRTQDDPSLRFVPWQWQQHGLHPVLRDGGSVPLGLGLPVAASCATTPTPANSDIALRIRSIVTAVGYRCQPTIDADMACAIAFLNALAAAVAVRTSSSTTRDVAMARDGAKYTPIALLFSGGIDCSVLAALCHYLLPPEQPIELINVSFADPPESSPDRVSCISSMQELLHLPTLPGGASNSAKYDSGTCAMREWRLVFVDASPREATNRARILNLIYPRSSVMDDNIGTAIWYGARGVGRCVRLAHAGRELQTSDDDSACAQPTETTSSLRSTTFVSHSSLRIGEASGATAAMVDANATLALCDGGSNQESNAFDVLVEVLIEDAANTQSFRSHNNDKHSDDGVEKANEAEFVERKNEKYPVLHEPTTTTADHSSGRKTTGGVLLSTLGKEYGARLTPVWRRYGFRRLGAYLSAAEAAGYVTFGGGSTTKFVALCRPQDIEAARRRSSAGSPEHLRPFFLLPSRHSSEDDDSCYRCLSRVLLLGMGADETLGGYARYRRVFRQHEQAARADGRSNTTSESRRGSTGLEAVVSQMQKDFARLWTRNLGRDDRVVSDHGREGRFPYLDEDVLAAVSQVVHHRVPGILGTDNSAAPQDVSSCPLARASIGAKATPPLPPPPPFLQEVVDVALPEGIGDKKLLRTAARLLGLGPSVSQLHKRAIQFGSRIAMRIQRGSAPLSATAGGPSQDGVVAVASPSSRGSLPCADSVVAVESCRIAAQDGEAKRRRVE